MIINHETEITATGIFRTISKDFSDAVAGVHCPCAMNNPTRPLLGQITCMAWFTEKYVHISIILRNSIRKNLIVHIKIRTESETSKGNIAYVLNTLVPLLSLPFRISKTTYLLSRHYLMETRYVYVIIKDQQLRGS